MYIRQIINPTNRSAADRGYYGVWSAKALLAALVLPLLVACQTTPPVHPDQAENFRQVDLFLGINGLTISGYATDVRESAIVDWGHLNEQALILAVGSDRQVLVTLEEPCDNLQRAREIGFQRALSFVVMDPLGNGFDIRESFGEYLNSGDDLILALSEEELDEIKWQPDGPGFGQLGECPVGQLYYLEPIEDESTDEELASEPNQL